MPQEIKSTSAAATIWRDVMKTVHKTPSEGDSSVAGGESSTPTDGTVTEPENPNPPENPTTPTQPPSTGDGTTPATQ